MKLLLHGLVLSLSGWTGHAFSGAHAAPLAAPSGPEIWASGPGSASASATVAPLLKQPALKSELDALLLYQILVAELELQRGMPGAGFSFMLEAARRSGDETLFQRAVEMALQARSGDAALQAARAWKRQNPDSLQPNRYVLQILLALNRIEEAGRVLSQSLEQLPPEDKRSAIMSIPTVFARVHDKSLAAKVVQQALGEALEQGPSQASAWTTVGRLHRQAQQWPQAIEAAMRGHAADPAAPGPIVLGISLLPTGSIEIGHMLDRAMQGATSAELRLTYARALIALPAHEQALQQLHTLTAQHEGFAPAWLMLGLLQADMQKHEAAQASLRRYIALLGSTQDAEQQAGLTEALLALSRLAEQQGDLAQAAQWLKQIPPSADPVRVAVRRAQLLDQQGHPQEAQMVLEHVPTVNADQAQRKALALAQWLRNKSQAQRARTVVEQALVQHPDVPELLTEQSLVLEKLKDHAAMEAVLRRLMRISPNDQHAFNALGYSLADRGLRLGEAKTLITRALDLAPQDPYIQDSLGWVEFRLGRRQEALRLLQAAFNAKPDAEIAAHLGEVLWVLGQREEAAKIWREGLMLQSDNETLRLTIQRLGFKP